MFRSLFSVISTLRRFVVATLVAGYAAKTAEAVTTIGLWVLSRFSLASLRGLRSKTGSPYQISRNPLFLVFLYLADAIHAYADG